MAPSRYEPHRHGVLGFTTTLKGLKNSFGLTSSTAKIRPQRIHRNAALTAFLIGDLCSTSRLSSAFKMTCLV
jgi:hypothetical protein